jgi:ABC-type multidrug transport system fused ATPase/permease subunit
MTDGARPIMHGLVEFRGVDFSYPTRPNVPVLRNFNLTIPTCTTAALVGSSGAGKSTVVALLQRFYDVDAG